MTLISLLEFSLIHPKTLPAFLARLGIIVVLLLIVMFHKKIYLKRVFPLVMLIVFVCMIIVILLDLIYSEKESDAVALEVMYIILLVHHSGQIPLSKVVPAFVLIFIPWGILGGFSNDATGHAANCAFVIVFAVINSSAIYTIENHLRTYFNLRGFAEKEISKTDKLLTQMMPPHVLENMRHDKTATDSFRDVPLLYADIVGFTAWSSDKSPKEVVGMLSELFTRFDKKCLDHHVYKVHTIGDCYVVMGLMAQDERDPAVECYNVVCMARSMIQVIKDINLENGSELNMRIGIHVGEIIAGITGTNIVRYDIYGPDVLMANKMESGGLAGKINVSDVTRELLEKFKPGVRVLGC
jgi:class 3 adenylate cyclase